MGAAAPKQPQAPDAEWHVLIISIVSAAGHAHTHTVEFPSKAAASAAAEEHARGLGNLKGVAFTSVVTVAKL